MFAGIRDIFTAIANQKDDTHIAVAPLKEVYVTPVLYQMLRNLHRDMVSFTGKLAQVMETKAHRTLMATGRSDQFSMPDEKAFQKRLVALQIYLETYDPGSVTSVTKSNANGQPINLVCLPVSIARGYIGTCLHSADFLEHFGDVLNRSEYFKLLRKLKGDGHPYDGPHSLLEYFMASFTIQLAAAAAARESPVKALPVNWVRLSR